MFGIVAAAGGVSKNITFVNSSTSTSSTITIPSFQNGDYVFIFQSNSGTSTIPDTPSNFTSITTGSLLVGGGGGGLSLGVKVSYKKMVTGESRNISLSGLGIRAVSLLFRPDFIGTGEDYGSPNTQTITGTPATQTVVGPSTSLYPHIIFGHYSATGTVSPRTSSVTMSEVTGGSTSQYVKYKIYDTGDTSESVNISMQDEGTNSLQSFYFQIQG
jgi:hypothetical protein